jgi:pyruvate dehydrogenase E1 component alpha subunit
MKKEELVNLYYKMLLIRRFEERAAEMYASAKIGGYCHLYIGQEAVAVGAISAIRDDDYVITAYRDHGHALVKGSDPKKLMAELLGKSTGIARGKGGSMHFFDAERNFMGGHGIVGGHLPIAVGLGYAINYLKTDRVVLCFFGDAATNIGAFHESLNMAALWKLPVIFIIENNLYGMGTSVGQASAVAELYRKGCAYNMESYRIDGQDALEVREGVEKAVKAARNDKRPTLIEAATYRYRGHSMTDPGRAYRTREEVDEWRQRDPIELLGDKLSSDGILTKDEADRLDKMAKEIAQESVDFALGSPEPTPDMLAEDVYA